ncbi:MAG: FAD-dependent oxidoreductase, partial [Clostridia bacterium]|nr:FAD-dependent oxidoreductase [Clostridia bacterium]
PRELGELHIKELQQKILKADGFLPGFQNEDPLDLARGAEFSATSYRDGCEPSLVTNGISRKLGENFNGWCSRGISEDGETLTMKLSSSQKLTQLRLTFHSDFRYPIRVTMAPNRQKQQRPGVPAELIKDYTVTLLHHGEIVREIPITDNYQRLNVLTFPATECDEAKITVRATNGAPDAVIFEVRAYE